jgi:citrate lyase subunit beta/citryl-CoA lyase
MPGTVLTPFAVRSLLFVPGGDERKLAKVGRYGADAVALDLEDAVPEEGKDAARALTAQAVAGEADLGGGLVTVRVNGAGTGRMEEDVAAVAHARLDAILLPKAERPEELRAADAALAGAERRLGLPAGRIGLLPIVESALGLVGCETLLLAAPARTPTAALGTADLASDLGVEPGEDGLELLFARSRLVAACRAAGRAAPLDGPHLAIHDPDGLLADSRRSRRLGFQGRVLIHPAQVEPAHRAYGELSDAEAERARRIVTAFEEAAGRGVGALRVDGAFVDRPVYLRARAALERAVTASPRPPAGGSG